MRENGEQKLVKCMDNSGSALTETDETRPMALYITFEAVYTVLEEQDGFYSLLDDTGRIAWYDSERFSLV